MYPQYLVLYFVEAVLMLQNDSKTFQYNPPEKNVWGPILHIGIACDKYKVKGGFEVMIIGEMSHRISRWWE